MRRYAPDPAESSSALALRVDGLDRRLAALDGVAGDLAALGRGVAELAGQVRQLATHVTTHRSAASQLAAGTSAATNPASTAATTAAPVTGEGEGQPDWLTVTDPDVAEAWLRETREWVYTVLAPLGAVLTAPEVPCWPLHPIVVVELLAAQRERAAAYAGDGPTGVSEWLSRWQPASLARIAADVRNCMEDHGHRTGGRTYAVPRLDPGAVARWWVDGRGLDPDAVTAFTFTRLT